MPPVGLEPTISAGERPQTYALDRAATGNGYTHATSLNFLFAYQYNNNKKTNIYHCLLM